MKYSLSVTCSILLVSSNAWAMQSKPTPLTLTHIDATIAQYKKDPVTERIANYFITRANNHSARSYTAPCKTTATSIVHATLVALKQKQYPMDTLKEANKIFPTSADRPIRLVAYALDDICRAWNQQYNKKNIYDGSPSVAPEDVGALYRVALNRAALVVRTHDASYFANGMQKYLRAIRQNRA
jgi:hypothetical protein